MGSFSYHDLGINKIPECNINNPGEENNMVRYSSRELLLIFSIIHTLFMIIRLIAIVYFISQACKHAKKSKENQDIYTYTTFVLLSISSICLFLGRLIFMVGSFIMITTGDYQKVIDYYCSFSLTLNIGEALIRPGLGYVCQNLAFLINIRRWSVLLNGCNMITNKAQQHEP